MIYHGDLFDVLPTLEAESIDACVTDPPYGIGFMGRQWDTFKPGVAETRIVENKAIESDNPNLKGRKRGPASSPSAVEYNRSLEGQREFQAWCESWARGVLRVLKPGAYLLVCGAPRSYHRMASGLEDAGFEIRDCFCWLFSQGFPKSLNIGCRCADRKSTPQSPVRCVPETDLPEAVQYRTSETQVLLQGLPEQGVHEQGQERPAEIRGGQSGMEGRSDVQAKQGQLHRTEVRQMPIGVSTDGSKRRVRDGASSDRGASAGPLPAQNGSGSSSGPQHQEQFGQQSGTVHQQRSAQTGRMATDQVCETCGGLLDWAGFGTALKPAYEPIVLARKPFSGTLLENVAKRGTGALNIDACRIETGDDLNGGGYSENFKGSSFLKYGGKREFQQPLGRWPANVLLDEIAAEMLDEQSGESQSPRTYTRATRSVNVSCYAPGIGEPAGKDSLNYGDFGGASRFFYVAKPSREERDAGIYGLPERLNTAEIVYNKAAWVDAALSQRLQVDTDSLRRKVTGGSTIQCNVGSEWSMCWCGSLSTDPYHPAIRSIIATDRSSITGQRISNSSRRQHTNGCMAAAFGVMADGGNLADYAEFRSPWAERIGTSRHKDGRSTDDAGLATSVRLWLTSKPDNGGGPRVGARNSHPT